MDDNQTIIIQSTGETVLAKITKCKRFRNSRYAVTIEKNSRLFLSRDGGNWVREPVATETVNFFNPKIR